MALMAIFLTSRDMPAAASVGFEDLLRKLLGE